MDVVQLVYVSVGILVALITILSVVLKVGGARQKIESRLDEQDREMSKLSKKFDTLDDKLDTVVLALVTPKSRAQLATSSRRG